MSVKEIEGALLIRKAKSSAVVIPTRSRKSFNNILLMLWIQLTEGVDCSDLLKLNSLPSSLCDFPLGPIGNQLAGSEAGIKDMGWAV